jgi:hypothetical protein
MLGGHRSYELSRGVWKTDIDLTEIQIVCLLVALWSTDTVGVSVPSTAFQKPSKTFLSEPIEFPQLPDEQRSLRSWPDDPASALHL